jgi:hypothetical protein
MAKKQILQQAGDGTAVPTGVIGEVKASSDLASTAMTVSGNGYNAGTLTLGAGNWLIYANISIYGPPTTFTLFEAAISTVSATNQEKFCSRDLSTNAANTRRLVVPVRNVIIGSSTTYYLYCSATWSGGTTPAIIAAETQFYAIRIA